MSSKVDMVLDAPLSRQKARHFSVSCKQSMGSFKAICGVSYDANHSTKNPQLVTCKHCQKQLAKA